MQGENCTILNDFLWAIVSGVPTQANNIIKLHYR